MFSDGCFNLHKKHFNDRDLESDNQQEDDSTYAKEQLSNSDGGECKLKLIRTLKLKLIRAVIARPTSGVASPTI